MVKEVEVVEMEAAVVELTERLGVRSLEYGPPETYGPH